MNNTPRLGDTLQEILAQTPSQAKSKTLLQLLSEPDIKVPFLWGEIFPKGEFLGIVGKSGVNKSTFCRQLCLSIASRQTTFLNDGLTPTYGKAMYCFSEENENWIRRYLRKNCNGIDYNMRDLENMTVVNMQNFETGEDMLSFFREELTRQKFDLIVIDSYSDFIVKFNAKLNDNDSIRVLKSQIEFLKDGGCSILFNHHTSDKASALGTFLGANAFKQIVRSQLEIFEDGKQRILSCEKNSYGSKFEPMECDISEDFLFIPTGNKLTRSELYERISAGDYSTPAAPVGRPKAAPCDAETVESVFGDSKEMTTGEIVDVLNGEYGFSRSSGNRWINEVRDLGLIVQTGRGVYQRFVPKECPIINTDNNGTKEEIKYTMHPNYLDYIAN